MFRKRRVVAPEAITVRRMDFEFDDRIPHCWVRGEPFLTLLMTALSGSFPDGERFFVESVRHYRDQILDPKLKEDVRAFIGQEAHHAKEHNALNAFLTRKGLPVDRIERIVRYGLGLRQQRLSPARQLAMTCANEHFTAILADMLLSEPEIIERMDPQVRAIWIWHAIEESEHKAVAFDVYQEVVGDYWIRVYQMAISTFEFHLYTGLHLLMLLRHTGQHRDLPMILRGLNKLYGKPGWFRKLLPAYLDYYRPGFHPWQRDNSQTLAYWRERLEQLRTGQAKAA